MNPPRDVTIKTHLLLCLVGWDLKCFFCLVSGWSVGVDETSQDGSARKHPFPIDVQPGYLNN